MVDENPLGPSGLVLEIVIITLGALGVAAMFQDYAYFHRPELVTIETVTLKYCAVVVAVIASRILVRMHGKGTSPKQK